MRTTLLTHSRAAQSGPICFSSAGDWWTTNLNSNLLKFGSYNSMPGLIANCDSQSDHNSVKRVYQQTSFTLNFRANQLNEIRKVVGLLPLAFAGSTK